MGNKHISTYIEGLELLKKEAEVMMNKASGLSALTEKILPSCNTSDRNDILKAYTIIDSVKKALSRIEKSFNETKKFQQNIILGMLEEEKLDNYSHEGKLFYPSSTTRFNVQDRSKLEEFILNSGPSGLQIMGNSLNSDYIKNYIETHPAPVEQQLPAGVGTYTSTSLNMRSKK